MRSQPLCHRYKITDFNIDGIFAASCFQSFIIITSVENLMRETTLASVLKGGITNRLFNYYQTIISCRPNVDFVSVGFVASKSSSRVSIVDDSRRSSIFGFMDGKYPGFVLFIHRDYQIRSFNKN
jgi:hypothetical protein